MNVDVKRTRSEKNRKGWLFFQILERFTFFLCQVVISMTVNSGGRMEGPSLQTILNILIIRIITSSIFPTESTNPQTNNFTHINLSTFLLVAIYTRFFPPQTSDSTSHCIVLCKRNLGPLSAERRDAN